MKEKFQPAQRINHALTAALEKQALQWMARRAPRWLTSDQLTLLGFTAQIGAGIFYALAGYNRLALLAVIACIVLNWFGDSMDGTLYRHSIQADGQLDPAQVWFGPHARGGPDGSAMDREAVVAALLSSRVVRRRGRSRQHPQHLGGMGNER